MENLDVVKELMLEFDVVLSSTVADELDRHKESRSDSKAFKGRRALRFIKANQDKFIYELSDFNLDSPDSNIIALSQKLNCSIATLDRGMWIRAKSSGVEVVEVEENKESGYKGYKILYLDADSQKDMDLLANFYEDNSVNKFNLLPNQYLVIYIDDLEKDVLKWTGKEHVSLKLPRIKGFKPLNVLQRCAIDLLYDKDIPVKFIIGRAGAGKGICTVKTSLYMVKDKADYSKIVFVRNPVGSGQSVGFLPGTLEEKTEGFMNVFSQHLDMKDLEAERLKQQEMLEFLIPFYAKGRSIPSAFMIVDEAEDLSWKDIKTLGTRIEKDSIIAFLGDYNQAEKQYADNNALKRVIEELKGNPLVGVVLLDDDVRSEASKVFADL